MTTSGTNWAIYPSALHWLIIFTTFFDDSIQLSHHPNHLYIHKFLDRPLVNSHNCGKSTFWMGKLTISLAISKLPESNSWLLKTCLSSRALMAMLDSDLPNFIFLGFAIRKNEHFIQISSASLANCSIIFHFSSFFHIPIDHHDVP